jgi:hypothetical protein
LKRFLGTLIRAQTHSHGSDAAKRTREFRLLQRRLAAARLGVGWARQRVRPSFYEDLR